MSVERVQRDRVRSRTDLIGRPVPRGAMGDAAITVRGLEKSYGSVAAVRGIDLEIARGEVFALLGPNGAGKTTTVEILEGHRTRTAGHVEVLGHDPASGGSELRRHLGIVLQETSVERFLTVAETIDQFRGYYPSPLPLADVIEVVGLTEKRNERVGRLSRGQQRRLDVAVGLAGDPQLLFLDEPTTGFDPNARRGAWDMVRNLRSLGKTVFLTTHYMDEAQALADHVAVIADGVIVADGAPSSLADRQMMATRLAFRLSVDRKLPPSLARSFAFEGGVCVAETTTPTAVLAELVSWAKRAGVELEGLEVRPPTLEDVYLTLTSASPRPHTTPVRRPRPLRSGGRA